MKSLRLVKSFLFLFVVTSITASATIAQVQVSREIALKDFSEIHVTTGIELIITQGAAEHAKIVADDALIDAIVVEQSGNSVNIKWELIKSTRKRWLNRTAKVFISYQNLNLIEATEGNSVKTENTLKSNILSILVTSGAIVTAGIDCPELQMRTNSGASALLNGNVGKLKLESSSGSRVNAVEMTSGYASVTASSGADVKISVSKELQATASSGGNIRYKGNPVVENSAGSKSGNVKAIQ
ncbi:Putative auto-transporter adhesin, head GIN domain [Pedobacter westerhofensis]|uniref:Auto-transporter adhesin, head GIN domain n=1 Tax=Pedobacter westerhofensis TaxID=425512 RepID=A0A521F284_9SPHI|nr:head GIN domain-containing protein [Pedobacter westerhofensis]SMO90227.1 Putative auto-transporter adhesin, head GIN domain [Pedobacter westerhofensis]